MKSDGKARMFLMIGVMIFLSAHQVYGWEGSGDILQKSFEVSPGGSLNLDTDYGSVKVTGTTGNTVGIGVFHKRSALDVQFDKQGNDVSVSGRVKGGIIGRIWHHLFHYGTRTRFVITVPSRYNLDLRTRGGEIVVDNLEGNIRSRTSGGGLHFDRIRGAVSGRTSGGSVELSECAGRARIETSGGSILISDANGDVNVHTSGGSVTMRSIRGEVTADTSGGSINVRTLTGSIDATTSGGSIKAQILGQPSKECRLATSGGSVVVGLTGGVAVDVDAETKGGRVVTDFPVMVRAQGESGRSALQGRINGGGPLVLLRTSGGDIHIEKTVQH